MTIKINYIFEAGYLWQVNKLQIIHTKCEFLLTHQMGQNTKLPNDLPVNFSGATSGKVKVVARTQYNIKNNEQYKNILWNKLTPYLSLGYEYELLESIRSEAENISLPTSDILKGGSVLGNLGITGLVVLQFVVGLEVNTSVGVRNSIQAIFKIIFHI